MFPSVFRSGVAVCLAIVLLPGSVGAKSTKEKVPASDLQQVPSQSEKKAIEQFMMLTALYMMEMQWNTGWMNRTPDRNERARIMISADMSSCPQDFREAWLKQVDNPKRNYAAPALRKYGVSLSGLRKRMEQDFLSINPGIRPAVPLFDEGEPTPSIDLRTCGSRENILKAISALKAKLYGIDPAMAPAWKKAVERVMIEFTMNYMEAMVRLQFRQLSADDVERLFKGIKLDQCPAPFSKAWQHDLPFFIEGQFGSPELRLAPAALRYGVDQIQVMDFVKKKMREWEIETPTAVSLPKFIKEMQELRENILSNR